jgi:hypothetical protein
MPWKPDNSLPINNYSDVPFTANANVSHSAGDVKLGKGDPCRLVGLDLANIRTKTTAQLMVSPIEYDNGIWRLPTETENTQYTGGDVSFGTGVHWWGLSGQSSYPVSTYYGVAGGSFPSRANSSIFLPAVGYLPPGSASPAPYNQQIWGTYWTSRNGTLPSTGRAWYFYSIVIFSIPDFNADTAASIRCVRR